MSYERAGKGAALSVSGPRSQRPGDSELTAPGQQDRGGTILLRHAAQNPEVLEQDPACQAKHRPGHQAQAESPAARHSRADRRNRLAVGTALDRAFPNGAKCTIFLANVWPEK